MKKNDWLRERKQWFKDNPRDYYSCHYCGVSMMPAQTTLDHSNNRKHKGVLVPCCYFDNYRKGSISHDRYVQRYYPAHQCKEKPMTLTAKDSLGWAINSVTGRTRELVEAGYVEEAYKDKYPKTNRTVIYWRQVPKYETSLKQYEDD